MGFEALIARLKNSAFSAQTNTDIDLFIQRNAKEPMNELEMTKLLAGLTLSVERLQSESNSVIKAVSWSGAATSAAITITLSGNYTVILFGSGSKDTGAGDIAATVTITKNGVSGTVVLLDMGVPVGQIDMHQSLPAKVAAGEAFVVDDSITFVSVAVGATTVDANDRFTAIIIKEA